MGTISVTTVWLFDPEIPLLGCILSIWKDFSQLYYPETEIICVNPIGLKGIFKEVYTKSFIKEHPEILKEQNNIEYLED